MRHFGDGTGGGALGGSVTQSVQAYFDIFLSRERARLGGALSLSLSRPENLELASLFQMAGELRSRILRKVETPSSRTLHVFADAPPFFFFFLGQLGREFERVVLYGKALPTVGYTRIFCMPAEEPSGC